MGALRPPAVLLFASFFADTLGGGEKRKDHIEKIVKYAYIKGVMVAIV